jgi:hypothetical protein
MAEMPLEIPAPARRAAIALAAVLMLLPAATAQARIIELGQTAQTPTPACPGKPCLAVSRTTGYQAKVGAERNLFVAPEAGKIVAWTVTLGAPTAKQIAFFNDTLGGPASAGITVFRPGKKLYGRVTAVSPMEKLEPYFGDTVQFPLDQALPVAKGNVVALTVPTWAPALAIGFGNDTSWRATRPAGKCDDTTQQTAQTQAGSLTRFRCLYRTARLTYTVTLITAPVAKPKPTATPTPTPTPTPR